MLYFVLDVESVGLFGEGFAVGWVVIASTGQELANGILCAPPDTASGDITGRTWLTHNLPSLGYNCNTPREVRDKFWQEWARWSSTAWMCADCPWPVEANFLLACIADEPSRPGPYPIMDVATARLAKGVNPIGSESRLPTELPQHNPECDARQSARLLVEALKE